MIAQIQPPVNLFAGWLFRGWCQEYTHYLTMKGLSCPCVLLLEFGLALDSFDRGDATFLEGTALFSGSHLRGP